MKHIFRVLIPLVVLGACIFGDIKLASLLFSHLPVDLSWLFWAKFGICVGIAWLTAGFIVFLVMVVGAISCTLWKEKDND